MHREEETSAAAAAEREETLQRATDDGAEDESARGLAAEACALAESDSQPMEQDAGETLRDEARDSGCEMHDDADVKEVSFDDEERPRRARGGSGGEADGREERRGPRRGRFREEREREQKSRSILLDKLSADVYVTDIKEHFSGVGVINDIYIPLHYDTREPRGFAFVEFASCEEADEAVRQYDGSVLKGCTISVHIARHARKTPEDMRARRDGFKRSGRPRRDRDEQGPREERGDGERRRSRRFGGRREFNREERGAGEERGYRSRFPDDGERRREE